MKNLSGPTISVMRTAEIGGDSETLTMSEPGPSMINKVRAAIKCVVVVISGRPLVMEPT